MTFLNVIFRSVVSASSAHAAPIIGAGLYRLHHNQLRIASDLDCAGVLLTRNQSGTVT
jgi:hypothetical protein